MTKYKGDRIFLLPPDKFLLTLFKGTVPVADTYWENNAWQKPDPTRRPFIKDVLLYKIRYVVLIPLFLIYLLVVFILLLISIFSNAEKRKKIKNEIKTDHEDLWGDTWFSLRKIIKALRLKSSKQKAFKPIAADPIIRDGIEPYTENIPEFLKKLREQGLIRIVYLHKSQTELLIQAEELRTKNYIDDIWLYESAEDIIKLVEENDVSAINSFIAGWSLIQKKGIWNDEDRLMTNYRLSFNRLVEIKNLHQDIPDGNNSTYFEFVYTFRHARVILNKNSFLTGDVIYYYETEEHSALNQYISENYDSINEMFRSEGLKLIYVRKCFQQENIPDYHELLTYLGYIHPVTFDYNNPETEAIIKSVFESLTPEIFQNIIKNNLSIPNFTSPCFLHSMNGATIGNHIEGQIYSAYFLNGVNEQDWERQVDNYFKVLSNPNAKVQYRVVVDNEDYDSDTRFFSGGAKISQEVQNTVDELKNINNEKLILSSLIYIINSLGETQPELHKKLSKALSNKTSKAKNSLSRLVIDNQYRIWLPDYQNLEIVMSPLPKSFFFFMLKHPEGLCFKELNQHKKELIAIYSKVGNRLEMEQINKSINDLTDIRSNSVNEKCSRIKEAFISKINDSLAQSYYVSGGRDHTKLISLDQSLINFSQTF